MASCRKIIISLILLCVSLVIYSLTIAEAATYLKPADSGSIILPVRNNPDSIASMEGVRLEITAPNYFIPKSTSLLGPVSISPAATFQFKLDYEIASNAPEGSFDIQFHLSMSTQNCVPQVYETLYSFSIDTAPPTLELKDSFGSTIADGGFTNKTAITVTVNDSLNGSGIDKLEVRKDIPDTGTLLFSDDTDYGLSYTYNISGLSEGKVFVKAFDKAGNTISRQFLVDTTPPAVSYINASLGPGTKAETVTITATATDTLTVINGGSFYINQGQPINMWAKDGSFDELIDIVEGKASVSHLADGQTYTVSVRAKDKIAIFIT